MGRRSAAPRCLLCLASCAREESVIGDTPFPGSLVMDGAVNCPLLQRQLERIFILRNILDVPSSWCEDVLAQEFGGDPASWFDVCDFCMEQKVAKAWRIYHQILELELKMRMTKEEIRSEMQGEVLKSKNRTWLRQQQPGKIDGVIRNLVFPDIISEMDAEGMDDFPEVDVKIEPADDDWLLDESDPLPLHTAMSSSTEDDDDDDDPEFFRLSKSKRRSGRKPGPKRKKMEQEHDFVPPSFLPTGKRRRGRPRKGFPRPPAKLSLKPKQYTFIYCKGWNCKARFSSLEEVEIHQQEHVSRAENGGRRLGDKAKLDCLECEFPAVDAGELEAHIDIYHKPKIKVYHYKCPQCDFTCEKFDKLKSHYDQEHPPSETEAGGKQTSSELPVVCRTCNKKNEHLKAFTAHQRARHPEEAGIVAEYVECDRCGLKFANRYLLKSHVKMEHKLRKKFVCEDCGKGFQFLSRLERHKIMHTSKTKREFVCHLCGVDYAYDTVLEKHYKKCHPESNISDSSKTTGAEATHQCRYCDLTFPLLALLRRHLKDHKKEMGHQCPECGQYYVNKQGLTRHLRINHPTVVEEVPCPHCLKIFTSVEYMRDHIKKFCKLANRDMPGSLASRSIINQKTDDENAINVSVSGEDTKPQIQITGAGNSLDTAASVPVIENYICGQVPMRHEAQQMQHLPVQLVNDLSVTTITVEPPPCIVKADYMT